MLKAELATEFDMVLAEFLRQNPEAIPSQVLVLDLIKWLRGGGEWLNDPEVIALAERAKAAASETGFSEHPIQACMRWLSKNLKPWAQNQKIDVTNAMLGMMLYCIDLAHTNEPDINIVRRHLHDMINMSIESYLVMHAVLMSMVYPETSPGTKEGGG
jgi:hypothetical protein